MARILVFPVKLFEFLCWGVVCSLLLEAVSSSEDPVLMDQSSSTDVNEMLASPGTNLRARPADVDQLLISLK